MQQRRNSSVLAMELRLSCTKASTCVLDILKLRQNGYSLEDNIFKSILLMKIVGFFY